MKIEWTNQAEDRVYDIASYIALDSISEAKKWVSKIFDYVKRLEKKKVYILTVRNYRQILPINEITNINP